MNGEQEQLDSALYVSEPLFRGKGWLKFYGVLFIIFGVLSVVSISGILWCWVFFWIGASFLGAGGKIEEGHRLKNPDIIRMANDKIRLGFKILSIFTIVMFAIGLVAIILLVTVFAAAATQMQNVPGY